MMHTELAHTLDPEASHIAAESLNVSAVAQVKAAILYMLSVRPHAAFQLIDLYTHVREAKGWPEVKPDSVAKRLSELVNDHEVVDTGVRATSPYGRPATVWAVAR